MNKFSKPLVSRLVLSGAVAAFGIAIAKLMGDVTPAVTPTVGPTTMPAVAVAPTTAPAAVDVDRLINQLGSDDSGDRDLAQTKLVELGNTALPALKKAAESSDDPEIRSRAAAAMAQVKDHDNTDVTLITLHMKDASAQDVLAALSAQSQAQISTFTFGRGGADNKTITVDADQKPFWDVMTDVCGQLGVCPFLELSAKNQLRLQPMQRSWMQAPHEVSGPFFIGAAGIYRMRTIDLQGPVQIDDQFSVRLVVCPEPKMAVVQISNLELKEATDDLGHSLIPKAQPARAGVAAAAAQMMLRSFSSQGSRTIETRLQYPEHPGTKIALLSGELKVMVAQDVQQYVVDDVMGTQKVTTPLKNCNVQVAVSHQGASTNGTYLVTMTVTRDGMSDDQWSALVSRSSDMTLEDADGHQLAPLTIIPSGQSTETTYSCQAYFSRNAAVAGMLRMPMMVGGGAAGGVAVGGVAVAGGAAAPVKVGEPKKLTWNVATALKTIKVPVELKDLPMP